MPKDKAPGIDGFPVEFFTKQWSIVKQDVMDAVNEFFRTGRLLKENERCGGDLVSSAQSAFIKGRSIIDNVLFTHELMKWYTRKGLSPRFVMKIDLRKEYDSIEWSFLEIILSEYGFPFKFTQWIMECLRSVSYSLILYGGTTEVFDAKKGIRQGDPMSPYLFVLAMEYLQREFYLLKESKEFKYHPRCKRLGVVHVCFADDLLLFCKADIRSITLLQEAFSRFSKASGLQANTEKSQVYLAGVMPNLKEEILRSLGYVEGQVPFKYLGVPLSSKKLAVAQYMPIVERVTEKLRCWSAKLLSYAGRTQLIKSVIFGIQTYWAQIFVLPKKILKLVEQICRTYLWTGSVMESKKALVSWEKVCRPKTSGGQNVIDMCYWNCAAILKQLWAVQEEKECLWVKWLQMYYIKGQELEVCSIPASATWVLRKIISARQAVMDNQVMQGDLKTRLNAVVKEGRFSIKKMYTLLRPQYEKVSWKHVTMHKSIHPRHRFILWLAAWRRLAPVDRLSRIGIIVPQLCVFCKGNDDYFQHLFFECETTRKLWLRLSRWLGYARVIGSWDEELEWADRVARKKSAECEIASCMFGMVIATIWKERNKLRFQAGSYHEDKVCKEIVMHIHIKGRNNAKWKEVLNNKASVP